MKRIISALDRGEATSFSRSSYEVVFSVFMIALAWFYRGNPLIVYPQILYGFLLLLVSNFIFSFSLRRRASVNLWLIDAILLVNFWVITGIQLYSGGGDSYFWVLYLLPVFAASLLARVKDAAGMLLLCVLALVVMSWPVSAADLAGLLSLSAKISVLCISSWVVFTTAQARKITEAGLAFKRAQVEALSQAISEKETELVRTASSSEMGTLVSGVMHDLGNAISVILMSAEIAAQDEQPARKDIERILRAAKFSRAMALNALSIVRGQDYAFETVNLRDIGEAAIMLAGFTARKKGVFLSLDLPDGLPALRASPVHLQRALINAVLNSVSFLGEGGRVKVSASAEGSVLRLCVADSGPGFPEHMLKEGVKAFGTTRKESGGTGLGLFVCDQVARRHGGRLEISNAPEGGACVALLLPLSGPA